MKSTVLGSLAVASLAASVQTSLAAQEDTSGLRGVIVELQAVGDSGSYLRYDYSVRNPGSSSWAIAVVRMGLKAPKGTGTKTLPATGGFKHLAGGNAPVTDHVPTGPISPSNWKAYLISSPTAIVTRAILQWHGSRSRGPQNLDSIAPGASLSGFGIRSTYLPGIRSVQADPTWQSCCAEPRGPENTHPVPAEFLVAGLTVGPTLHPDSVSIQVLQGFRGRTCTELRWITDAGVCASLGGRLDRAGQALTQADRTGARAELRSFVSELEAQHGAGRPVNDNAYWLLRVNAEFLLRHLE